MTRPAGATRARHVRLKTTVVRPAKRSRSRRRSAVFLQSTPPGFSEFDKAADWRPAPPFAPKAQATPGSPQDNGNAASRRSSLAPNAARLHRRGCASGLRPGRAGRCPPASLPGNEGGRGIRRCTCRRDIGRARCNGASAPASNCPPARPSSAPSRGRSRRTSSNRGREN